MAGRITGRVEVFVNGKILLNRAGAKAIGIGVSGKPAFERQIISGDTGVHGYIEKPIIPRCEVPITDRSDISLSDLASIDGNGRVIFRTAGGTGKTYIMENATCLSNFTVTAGEGEVSNLIFEGLCWVEQGVTDTPLATA